ncbi:MAG: DNA polymerase III subunit delta [Deltaproteobacteria bacterium]|nr:DNA polymerase III subunit delta [Deltaproteobacteria bacterium]
MAKTATDIFKSLLSAEKLPGTILVLAPDLVRRERAVEALVNKFSDDPNVPVKKWNAQDINKAKLTEFAEASSALSLFSSKQIFLISNIEKLNSSITDSFLKILEKSDGDSLFICHGEKLAKNSKVLKFFTNVHAAVVLETPKSPELRRWVSKELQRKELKADTRTLQALVDMAELEASVNSKPVHDILYSRIERLALYVDSETITLNDLKNLFPDVIDPNEFDFVNAIASGDVAKAEGLIDPMFKAGKNPFLLLSLINRNYSDFAKIRLLQSQGKTPAQIRETLNMNQWRFQKVLEGVKAHSLPSLQQDLQEIANIDAKLKNRSLSPENLFSELVFALRP